MTAKHLGKAFGLFLLLPWIAAPGADAGPHAPAAGQPGSTAVHRLDSSIAGWATGYASYIAGEAVDPQWQTPGGAIGPAEGTQYDVVCLGQGGEITLTFDTPVYDGPGWDFAVFENAFSDTYLELAYVEASSDGVQFIRFPCDSLTPGPVGEYGVLDPTDVDGLAGKYRAGYGTPFDLEALVPPMDRVTHVRILDVVGDGADADSDGDAIYDPYPTTGSAGFDLDAAGYAYTAKCYVDKAACGGNEPCYPWIRDGLNLTASGGVVEAGQGVFEEIVVMDMPKRLAVRGGWDMTFWERPGWTTIQGGLVIARGTVVVENLVIEGMP